MNVADTAFVSHNDQLVEEVKNLRIVGEILTGIFLLVGAVAAAFLFFRSELGSVREEIVRHIDIKLDTYQKLNANALVDLARELKLPDPERYRSMVRLDAQLLRLPEGRTLAVVNPISPEDLDKLAFARGRTLASFFTRHDAFVTAASSGKVVEVQPLGTGSEAKVVIQSVSGFVVGFPEQDFHGRKLTLVYRPVADVKVKEGDVVTLGDRIGRVSSPSRSLQFEVLFDDKPGQFLKMRLPESKQFEDMP